MASAIGLLGSTSARCATSQVWNCSRIGTYREGLAHLQAIADGMTGHENV